jgi:hypothetical protein
MLHYQMLENPVTSIVPPATRRLACLGSLALVGWSVLYLVWAEAPIFLHSHTQAQGQSVIAPWVMMQRIAQQLQSSGWFDSDAGLLRSIGSAFLVFMWAVITWGVGYGLVVRLKISWIGHSGLFAFSALTGLALVGTLTVLLGIFGGLQGYIGRTSLALVLLTGCIAIGPRRLTFRAKRVHLAWLMAAPILLALILCCCTPPVQSDAMRYHLAAPQEWLKFGRIRYLPLNAFSNFPMLIEVQALLVGMMGLQLVHFLLMLTTGASVYALALRLSSGVHITDAKLTSIIAALLYIFTPAGAVVATWPNIDHATSLCVLLSTYALLLVMDTPTRGAYALLGITAGAALSVKYTLLAHLGLLCAAWTGWLGYHYNHSRKTDSKTATALAPLAVHLRWALLATVIAVLTASPWYVKNLINTGNPVYPFASKVFSSSEWTSECAELYSILRFAQLLTG